jgi:hypothetical protein
VAPFLGRRLEYVYQVVEDIRQKRLVMRTADGPFPMETTYEWEPTETGTRTTLRNRVTPSGFSRIVAPFMAAAMRRANQKRPRCAEGAPGVQKLRACGKVILDSV